MHVAFKILLGVIAIIFVALACLYVYVSRKIDNMIIEHFEASPQYSVKDTCTVYFTDNIAECDASGTINGVDVNYGYHLKYYENLRDTLVAQGQAGTQKYQTVLNIIEDYRRSPDGQSCKMSVPDWKQMAPTNESVTLGPMSMNSARGPSQHWAFCLSDNIDNSAHQNSALSISKDANNNILPVTIDGMKYTRGAFSDFGKDTMTRLSQCASAPSTASLPPFTGFRVDPSTNAIEYIYNNEVKTIDANAVADLISAGLCKDQVQMSSDGTKELLYMIGQTKPLPVVKFEKDLCGRLSIRPLVANINLGFKISDSIKSININDSTMAHLRGNVARLNARKKQLQAKISAKQQQLQAYKPRTGYASRQDYLNGVVKELRKNSKMVVRYNKQINALKYLLGWATTAAAAGFAGAIVSGIAQLIIKSRIRKIEDKKRPWAQNKYYLETNFTNQRCDILSSKTLKALFRIHKKKKTNKSVPQPQRNKNKKANARRQERIDAYNSKCNSFKNATRNITQACKILQAGQNATEVNKTCPMNLPFAKRYFQEVKPMYDYIRRRQTKINQINATIADIRKKQLTLTRSAINTSSIVLSNPPYHALSYDNKFYVQLA